MNKTNSILGAAEVVPSVQVDGPVEELSREVHTLHRRKHVL